MIFWHGCLNVLFFAASNFRLKAGLEHKPIFPVKVYCFSKLYLQRQWQKHMAAKNKIFLKCGPKFVRKFYTFKKCCKCTGWSCSRNFFIFYAMFSRSLSTRKKNMSEIFLEDQKIIRFERPLAHTVCVNETKLIGKNCRRFRSVHSRAHAWRVRRFYFRLSPSQRPNGQRRRR